MDSGPAPPVGDDVSATLRALGISEDAIARALKRGDPEGAIFEAVLLPAIAERTISAAEIEQRGGLSVAETQAFVEAYGLGRPEPDAPAFTPDEAEVFVELKHVQDIWPSDLGIQIARVYGRMLARIAQAEIQLFRGYVEPRLRRDDPDRLARLRAVQTAFERLLPLADPLLLGVHRRWVEHELAHVAASEVEAGSGMETLPGAVDVAFLFCDLKDFTAFADEEGDSAAVAAIDRFAETVTRERGTDSRFTKALGDGFMLAYGDSPAAVGAGARIIDAMKGTDVPGVHASVHQGIAIAREGDYFGTAVNLAARLLNVASRDELVATRATVERAGEGFTWERVGEHHVRGVSEPVEVFLLQAAAAA